MSLSAQGAAGAGLLLTLAVGGPAPAAPFSDGCIPAIVIHVATNGNDDTGDGSLGQPYQTIARAALAAAPGRAITLHPGTYGGDTYLENLHGLTNAPIWIRGLTPTNRPVLQGGGEGLHLIRPRCVIVENLVLTGSSDNGLNTDDGGDYADPEAARFVVFSNLYIHHVGSGGNEDGLKLSGLNDFWVLNSEIMECGGDASGSGVDMVGCRRGVVEGCYFHDLSANAVQCKGGTAQVDIRRSRIINAGHRGINIGGSTGFEYFRPPLSTSAANTEASDIRVYANLFQGSTAAVAYVGAVNCLVANNTIVNPTRWVLRILQETVSSPPYTFTPCRSNRFDNNIVYFNSAVLSQAVNIGPDTDSGSFVFANTLWYAHNNPAASTPSLPGTVVNLVTGQNPAFASAAASNYAITVQSPAATNGALNGLGPDFAGNPFLSPPSRGAHEVTGDTDADGLPDAWELRYLQRLSDGAGDDPDADRQNNAAEYGGDTHPNDPASLLRLSAGEWAGAGVRWTWSGGVQSTQWLEVAETVSSSGGWNWRGLITNRPPTALTNAWTDPAVRTAAVYRLRAGR